MGRRESIEIWSLRRPMKRESFLKEKKLPKEKIERIPERVWVEVGPVNSFDCDQIWRNFEEYKKYKKEEDLILLGRKTDNSNWRLEGELKEKIEFFVVRPIGIDKDFLERKKLFLVPDEKILKNLKDLKNE